MHNNNPGPLVAVIRGDILDSRKVVGGLQRKKNRAFFVVVLIVLPTACANPSESTTAFRKLCSVEHRCSASCE